MRNGNSSDSITRSTSQNSDLGKARSSPTGAPASPRRKRFPTGQQQQLDGMAEDEVFIHILDLLEMQDEFEASTGSDRDSEVGDDLSSVASDLEDEEEDWDPRDESCWKLSPMEVSKAIQDLRARRLPAIEVCKKIVRSVIVHYSHQPNVIHIPAPEVGSRFVVVGVPWFEIT
ncbi:Serine/threonine-protein phosphatase [Durusdinium trenchii]|uniref:Serine/threonine-protein phosphatase n=1 Tax=Durusdinium trenchii TaxID=1381693 RepID=A0ABP0QNT1_9DINO